MQKKILCILILILAVSCGKVPKSDRKIRKLIIGEWELTDIFGTSSLRLKFQSNGLYQELTETGPESWKVIRDSIAYHIENGAIKLPHDQLGPEFHKILRLNESDFWYHAEARPGDNSRREFRRK